MAAKRLWKDAGPFYVLPLPVLWAIFWITDRHKDKLTLLGFSGSGTNAIVVVVAGAIAIYLLAYASFFVRLAFRRGVSKPSFALAAIWFILFVTSVFAVYYYDLGSNRYWQSVSLSHLSAIYLTVGTLTTAGVNGLTASRDLPRVLITFQMVMDIVAVTIIGTAALEGYREWRNRPPQQPT